MTEFHPEPAQSPKLSQEQGGHSSKRRLLLNAAAATAAAVGVGVALWRLEVPQGPAAVPPIEGFWSMQWDTPQGTKLTMDSFRGRALLVNFWATWCTPCVEELPLINDFYLQNKPNGWQVLGLAVDKLVPVQSFLQKMPLDFPIGMAGATGAELGRSLGNLAGGLPFSVVLNRGGMVVQRKLGRLNPADLGAWLRLK
jgi:thiol-disulfide isomerase/thioredoxin